MAYELKMEWKEMLCNEKKNRENLSEMLFAIIFFYLFSYWLYMFKVLIQVVINSERNFLKHNLMHIKYYHRLNIQTLNICKPKYEFSSN